jgi:xylulokinase
MPHPPLLLGIDVGTGGSKALLIDAAGAVRASALTGYPLSTPRPLWSEQDPDQWWSATVTSIRAVLETAGVSPANVAAVGLTGQMHGLVLLDGEDRVLRPAILWNDQRTGDECREIHDRLGADTVIRTTGKPALTGFTAPKVLWVRRHEPDVYGRARRLLLPKDFVRFRLTGVFATDVADASGTCLFDVTARDWSETMIEALDVPRSWLPQVTESPVPVATVSAEAGRLTGLPAGTPVVAGAGDQAAEAIGCGVVDDGAVSVTIGTSGVVFGATAACRHAPSGRMHTYCHAAPDLWHVMGVMLSAGGSYRWYRDTLGREEVRLAEASGADPYDLLNEQAASAPAGCEGLIFLPYLTGERTPHADPHARGAFVGLTLRHNSAILTRSVMEGVTFGLMDCLELAREMGLSVETVRVSGGGARSSLWRQMMADVFRAEIVTVNVTQGAAYGAALLAGAGVGVYSSVPDAARTIVKPTGTTRPGPDVEVYQRQYERYRALYPVLAPEFKAMGEVVSS